jgi:hypothetical protein
MTLRDLTSKQMEKLIAKAKKVYKLKSLHKIDLGGQEKSFNCGFSEGIKALLELVKNE